MSQNLVIVPADKLAELRRDAAKFSVLMRWLRDGHIPGPGWGKRIKLIETCPQFGDESQVFSRDLERLLDAAVPRVPHGVRENGNG